MELSVMATRSVKSGMPLEASLEVSLPEAGDRLRAFYAPVLKPDETIDLTSTLDLNLRKLRWCREQVIEADLNHQAALERLSELLHQRTDMTSTVGGKLVRLRRICLGLFDEEELLRLGLDGTVAQDSTLVYRQGQKVVWRFRQPDLELASSTLPQIKVEVSELAEALAGDVKSFGELLHEIDLQRRRVQRAAARKRQAIEDFDFNYLHVGRITESCYFMAGMDDEAQRARPSVRRSGRGQDAEEQPPEEEPQPDDAPAEDPPPADDAEPEPDPGPSPDGETPPEPVGDLPAQDSDPVP